MAIVTSGLVGYWNVLQGLSGTAWSDLSSSANNITLFGTGGHAVTANGMLFDGTDDYGSAANTNDGITFGSAFTYEVDFAPSTISTGGVLYHIIGSYTSGTGITESLAHVNNTLFIFHSSLGGVATSYTTLALNTPIHVAVRFDPAVSSTLRRVYINGTFLQTVATSSFAPQFSGQIAIGRDATNSSSHMFKGNIAFARLYNRALTDAEITQNYSNGTPVGLGTFNTKSLSETITISETFSKASGTGFAKSLADSITTTDAITKIFMPLGFVTNNAIFSDNSSNAPRAYGKGGNHFGVLPVSGAKVILVNSTTDVSLVIIPNGGMPQAPIEMRVNNSTYIWGYSSMYVDPTLDIIYVALFEERTNSGYTGKFTIDPVANTSTKIAPIYQNLTGTKTGYLITSTPSEVVMSNNMVIGVGGWVSATANTAGATYAPIAYSYDPKIGTTTAMSGVVTGANAQLATQTVTSNYNMIASIVKIGSTAYAFLGCLGTNMLKLHQIATSTAPNTVTSTVLASYTLISPLGITDHNESLGELCTDGADLYFAYTNSTTTIQIVKWSVVGATSSVVATITGLSKVTDLGIEYFNGNLWLGWCDGVTQTTNLEAVYATYSTTGTVITARTVVAGGDALGYIGSRMTVVSNNLLYGYSKGTVSPTTAYYGVLASTATAYSRSLSDSVATSETFSKIFLSRKSLNDSMTLSESVSKAASKSRFDVITGAETISKLIAKSRSDSIITSDAISKRLTVTVVDTIATSTADTISARMTKLVNLNDSIAIVDAISKSLKFIATDFISASESKNISIVKRLSDVLSVLDITVSSNNSKLITLSDSISISDVLAKSTSRIYLDTVAISDILSKKSNKRIYDVIITIDSKTLLLATVPKYIGTIQLKGEKTLYIYLVGDNNLNIDLKGGLQ